jgi:hypothetical protein
MLRRRYDAAVTMFVLLRGRSAIEYYFGLRDAFRAANDPGTAALAHIVGLPRHLRRSRRGAPHPPL